jgi:hypothetical protein
LDAQIGPSVATHEVLAALNIRAGGYGSFDSLDLSGSTDGDHILTAISALFVYGNSAGPLSQLIADFQSDIGASGVITNAKTAAALVAAAKGMDPVTIASNLTQFYATEGVTFKAEDITEWIARSGDGVIGKFIFSESDATPSTAFTFPPSMITQFAGPPVSTTVGQLSVNGTPASGAVSFKAGDVVTLSPAIGDFPNSVLTSYLATGKTNPARVSFVSGLVSIAVTPGRPSIPPGLTQQFEATGTFSDTSTAHLTSRVVWASSTEYSERRREFGARPYRVDGFDGGDRHLRIGVRERNAERHRCDLGINLDHSWVLRRGVSHPADSDRNLFGWFEDQPHEPRKLDV